MGGNHWGDNIFSRFLLSLLNRKVSIAELEFLQLFSDVWLLQKFRVLVGSAIADHRRNRRLHFPSWSAIADPTPTLSSYEFF